MKRRTFTPEFKRSAVSLVIDQSYSRQHAAENLIDISILKEVAKGSFKPGAQASGGEMRRERTGCFAAPGMQSRGTAAFDAALCGARRRERP